MTTNKRTPLVTCIITCYQKFDYLFEAVDSVLIQKYPRIELLITDDGSDNFPQKAVDDYVNLKKRSNIERVIIHHNSKNLGTVRNINGMLSVSQGDYFINLDGDDVFYDADVFSKVVKRFIDTGVDFLPCSRLQCDENLQPIQVLPTKKEKQAILKMDTPKKLFDSFCVFRFLNIASGSALYFSRKHLNQMGPYDEHYRNWQDGPRITEYVRLGNMIHGAYDIIAVKYRSGGVSNAPKNNISSAQHLHSDYVIFERQYTIPNKRTSFYWERRKRAFWLLWDTSQSNKERIILLLKHPDYAVIVLNKKLRKQPLR